MASLFEKWNKSIDAKGLAKDVEEIEKNGGGQYKEVPYGTYEVKVEKMELKESKKGDPMLSIWFKIIKGTNKDSIIFYNQVISTGFQIHFANEMLRSLESDVDVVFTGDYGEYNEMVLDICENVKSLEYALDYGEDKKGYKTYTIQDVFEAE